MRDRRGLMVVAAVLALAMPTATSLASEPVAGHHEFAGGVVSDVDCVATGWAVDVDDPETEVQVRALIDATVVASRTADDPRPDVVEAGIDTDGASGFFFDLTGLASPGVEHEIVVQAQDLGSGMWNDLESTGRLLLCTGMGGFHDAASGAVARPECFATGWTRDRDDPSRRLQVRVLVDDAVVGETIADQFRQDILDAGLSDGFSGWFLDLWEFVTPGSTAVVHVEALDEDSGLWFTLSDTDREISCVDDSDALFIVDLRTGTRRQLTNLPSSGEYNAAWSPDGRFVAHDVVGDVGHQLYLTEARTGVSFFVPGDHLANDPSWSPDGKFVVIDRLPDGDASVFWINVRTGEAEPIVGDAFDADWHPDADRIVYVRPSSSEIVVRDLRTDAEWTIAVIGAGVSQDPAEQIVAGINPCWSPDGRWILYSDGGDLYKIRLTGASRPAGTTMRLTETDTIENGADWSGDGTWIALKSDALGDFGIYRLDAGGGEPSLLLDAAGIGDYDPAVSGNGRYLVYTSLAAAP